MRYGILDKYLYKPFWIVGVLSIVVPIANVEGFLWSLWAYLVAGSLYVLVILLPVFHRPKKLVLNNIREIKVENPIKSASRLLGSEFRITEGYNVMYGAKTYGLAGAFRTEFNLSNDKGCILVTISTNSPVPENILQIKKAMNSIEEVFMSVGYARRA
ncbi:hypothetical protein [Teredinibacter turnerae]|uniref:hypothetical protein n=1 Tax=Teredinibacter turnerae TaxID=2426 RepID=UPI00048F1D4E|nr:hypothetical protein [Teredinibacter turnerae]